MRALIFHFSLSVGLGVQVPLPGSYMPVSGSYAGFGVFSARFYRQNKRKQEKKIKCLGKALRAMP